MRSLANTRRDGSDGHLSRAFLLLLAAAMSSFVACLSAPATPRDGACGPCFALPPRLHLLALSGTAGAPAEAASPAASSGASDASCSARDTESSKSGAARGAERRSAARRASQPLSRLSGRRVETLPCVCSRCHRLATRLPRCSRDARMRDVADAPSRRTPPLARRKARRAARVEHGGA
jgi:hypothetical protein